MSDYQIGDVLHARATAFGEATRALTAAMQEAAMAKNPAGPEETAHFRGLSAAHDIVSDLWKKAADDMAARRSTVGDTVA